jgi:integrase
MLDIESRAYFNFVNSLKSDNTRIEYERKLNKFLTFYNLTAESLLLHDPKDLEIKIIDYLVYLRKERHCSFSHNNIVVCAIRKFCQTNDLTLNWDKICQYKGDEDADTESADEGRGYSHEEIGKMLAISDYRMKVIILLLASTGMRVGALIPLCVGNLEKILESGLYSIIVYKKNRKSKYETFCTPECASAIDDYLEYRKRNGEKIVPDSPIIRKDFDPSDLSSIRKKAEPISYDTLRNDIYNLVIRAGIRTVDHNLEPKNKHKEVPLTNGFRRFCNTIMNQCDVNWVVKEKLIGHHPPGLEAHYFRPSRDYILSE